MIDNRFSLLKEIGTGGQGKVFKAIDTFKK